MSLTEIRETLNNNKNTFEKFIENINQQSIINGIVQLKQKMKNNHNNEAIYSLLITKNNKLVSGGNDNKICVFNYDENSGKYAFDYCLTGHIKCVNSLCELLSKENHILSGSGDNTIKAWDLLIKQCVKTFYGHEGSVLKVIILKNSLIASCSTDKTIKLWKESNAECFGTLVGHNGWVRSIVEIKRNTLVSAGDDKTLRLWNLEKLTEEYSFKNIYLSDINGMVYNENEDLLYVGDFEKKIKILDMKNLTLVKEIQIKNATGLGINSITRLLDGSFIICLSQQENQLRKYTKDFVFDSTIDYPYKSYISCSISMRNNQFVLSDWNGNISIWSY